jgi:uncharacterized protein (TIGR02246 family)
MSKMLSLCVLVVAALVVQPGSAQESAVENTEQAALRQTMLKYEEAFNRADANGLAAYWTEAGQYVTASGEKIEGRDAIREAYAKLFAEEKGLRLEATTSRLQVIAASTAVEEGVARVTCSSRPPAETSYEAIFVKEDGQWRLCRVREAMLPTSPSHHEQLKDLGWMVGQWTSKDQTPAVSNQCEWAKNKNFIKRSFFIDGEDDVVIEGTQFIGWDASIRQICSWSFDSEGGFEHAVWRHVDNRWIVDATAVLPDGRQGSAERILTPVDDNAFTWRSVNRQVDGRLLPSTDEVTIVRTTGTSNK